MDLCKAHVTVVMQFSPLESTGHTFGLHMYRLLHLKPSQAPLIDYQKSSTPYCGQLLRGYALSAALLTDHHHLCL